MFGCSDMVSSYSQELKWFTTLKFISCSTILFLYKYKLTWGICETFMDGQICTSILSFYLLIALIFMHEVDMFPILLWSIKAKCKGKSISNLSIGRCRHRVY